MRLSDDQAKALNLGHLIPKRASRAPDDGMNKLERRFSEYLDWLKERGAIQEWWREPVKLRLAGRTFYTPDFLSVSSSGDLEFWETKGHMRDDAAVKIKVAAETYGHIFEFRLVYRDGRKWDIRRVTRRGIEPPAAAPGRGDQ